MPTIKIAHPCHTKRRIESGNTPKEINKGGLFAGDAIIVGKLGNNYIGLRGQQLVYLAAPTRSGKGTGVVNPVALSYNHSMVVLDIKKELWNISAAKRQKNGHKVSTAGNAENLTIDFAFLSSYNEIYFTS